MTYEIYRYIFIGGAILAGIMFAVSVFVFFKLDIAKVIGDLTGANERKAIESIRTHSEKSDMKTGRITRNRSATTDKISGSGRLAKGHSRSLNDSMRTEKISTQKLITDESENETTVLSSETTVLGSETTVLSSETTVLMPSAYCEPAVLSADDVSDEFIIEYELTYIHTDEVIA